MPDGSEWQLLCSQVSLIKCSCTTPHALALQYWQQRCNLPGWCRILSPSPLGMMQHAQNWSVLFRLCNATEHLPFCFSFPSPPPHTCEILLLPLVIASTTNSTTSIAVHDVNGQIVSSVCAGTTYKITVQFPEKRQSYLTMNEGHVDEINTLNEK